MSQDRWVWPLEGLVCGTVAKGEAVLCARSEIGLFWKREGEGSGGTETAQLTIPGAPEASVCAQPLAKWQWQVISLRLSCELMRLGMLLSCLNDSGQNKAKVQNWSKKKLFIFAPLTKAVVKRSPAALLSSFFFKLLVARLLLDVVKCK